MTDLCDTIDINVKTRYLAEHSHPEENRYVFAYDITIRNNGNESAQLLSRPGSLLMRRQTRVRGDGRSR